MQVIISFHSRVSDRLIADHSHHSRLNKISLTFIGEIRNIMLRHKSRSYFAKANGHIINIYRTNEITRISVTDITETERS